MFSFIFWAQLNNVPANQLFGVQTGLEMSFVTVPWWAEVHVFLGFVLFLWILVPGLYYTNVSPSFSPFLLRTHPTLVMETRVFSNIRKRSIR